ncbi:MAG: hypothetical protein RR326_01010 [Stenotrophomonas sp.]
MDYGITVIDMLRHVEANKTPENMTMLVRSLALGIASTSAMVNSMDAQSELLDNLFAAIRSEAQDLYISRHDGCSQADYLKHIYTPSVPNA